MWTIKTVKECLPDVPVKIGKKIVQGRIRGRLNKFASVSVTNTGTLHSGSDLWVDREVAWETLVYVLNDQTGKLAVNF